MLWEVEIRPAATEVDREGAHVLRAARNVGAGSVQSVASGRSYLIEGDVNAADIEGPALHLLADSVTETATVHPLPQSLSTLHSQPSTLLNVLFKPGVTDNIGLTAEKALADLGLKIDRVSTCRKYWVNADANEADLARLAGKVLSNDAIEHVEQGPLQLTTIGVGSDYTFQLKHIAIREMDDAALQKLSKEGQLYLSL
ncbi:MAG: phosphoribosylformylglycinamidine synthase subunit PurS, partial [Planctomycetaceae bacterium]|nr:phosphoribosylformylglycinamidine synthase subunit PurS [Planctomycetaceae bacterium]